MIVLEEWVSWVCLFEEIMMLWQIDEYLQSWFLVGDECEYVFYYLMQVIYWIVLLFFEDFEVVFLDYQVLLFLCFGFWVGGDMDGNLVVSLCIVLELLVYQCQIIQVCYVVEMDCFVIWLIQFLEYVSFVLVVFECIVVYLVWYFDFIDCLLEWQ